MFKPTSQRANEPTSQRANEPTSQRANEPTSQRANEPTSQLNLVLQDKAYFSKNNPFYSSLIALKYSVLSLYSTETSLVNSEISFHGSSIPPNGSEFSFYSPVVAPKNAVATPSYLEGSLRLSEVSPNSIEKNFYNYKKYFTYVSRSFSSKYIFHPQKQSEL